MVNSMITEQPFGYPFAGPFNRPFLGKPLIEQIVMPLDFVPTLPCDIYRTPSGKITHNMDFDQFKGGTRIYVKPTGNDTTGDGSDLAPYLTLKKALTVANAGLDPKYEIICSLTQSDKNSSGFTATIVNKTIAIISTSPTKTLISSGFTYTWTLGVSDTYSASRTGVLGVADLLNVDENGVPIVYLKATSQANCEATPGTWWQSGTPIYVHRTDGIAPTLNNTLVQIGSDSFAPILNNSTMYFENFIFANYASGQAARFVGTVGAPLSKICFKDCIAVSPSLTTGNAFSVLNIKDSYFFDCVAAYAQLDGYNYHYGDITVANVRECLGLEVNCKGYDLGLVAPGAGSNQVSSCHDGASMARFGTIASRSTGRVLFDVGGCYSVLYDCDVSTPVTTGLVFGEGDCYSFTSDGLGVGLGITYLMYCKASDCTNGLVVGSTHTLYMRSFTNSGGVINGGTIINI